MSKKITQQEAKFKTNKKVNTLQAKIYPTRSDMKISDFIKRVDTPGNVGVCLSGGGSTAMISALGQLRALNHMGLLSKVKALSTVSGGSWAAVPFTYLPDEISDKDFLGEFVEDPGTLTLKNLNHLPKGNMGQAVASKGIRWFCLLMEALNLSASSILLLFRYPSVRKFILAVLLKKSLINSHKTWTNLIGRHILKPFRLAKFNIWGNLRKSCFAYNQNYAQNIQNGNSKKLITCHTYQLGKNRIKRPFHLCNGAMFLTKPPAKNKNITKLVPLQSNAFGTGILGDFKSNNGNPVGGGLVASHAFNSVVNSKNGDSIEVKQLTPFSLADITSTSSAFFSTLFHEKIELLDPIYSYWPVSNPSPKYSNKYNFADGGCLENTGIPNLLAYNDIDNIISYINALQPVYKDIKNEETLNIVVDVWIPPLFGYTPYLHGKHDEKPRGYVLYDKTSEKELPAEILYFKDNQIFDSSRFEELCRALYTNCNNYEYPAAFYQDKLEVRENNLFCIKGEKKVNILWVHYNPVLKWQEQLKSEVKISLQNYVCITNLKYRNNIIRTKINENRVSSLFPNFVIAQTHMPKHIVNLFAHQTSWITKQLENTLRPMFDLEK